MSVKLVSYGIAKDIIGGNQVEYPTGAISTIGDLKEQLIRDYPDFSKLRDLRFAVNEDYQNDGYILKENDEVVIIPPVSGG